MKLSRMKAVFLKQFADTTHNRGIIIQFLVFPVLMVLLLLALPNHVSQNRITIVLIISTSFTGMMPILTVHNIIREDKLQNTLRVLIMSTVKPCEYLIGVTSYILFISLINAVIFGLLGGLIGVQLLTYVGVLMIGIVITLVFGSAMAMYSASRGGIGSFIMVVAMFNGIIPMISMFNPSFQKYSSFLYTYQINHMLSDIYNNCFDWKRLIILFVNFAIFFVLFLVSYKDNRFYE